MKKYNYSLLLFISFTLILQIGCTNYPVIQEPDVQMFNNTVSSDVLRDSLSFGKLTAGMPYFVVSQLFKNYSDGIKEVQIPVATVGSKQRLVEVEGWGRNYNDPNNIKVFLDKYETPKGNLYIWYERPDFYTMDVSQWDTLCVYYNDSVYCSVVNYLNKSTALTIKDSLPNLPTDTVFYGEIRYKNREWQNVTYWYKLQILSNAKTFKLGDLNYELYPIELLEFNDEPVSSFKWREVNKNEN